MFRLLPNVVPVTVCLQTNRTHQNEVHLGDHGSTTWLQPFHVQTSPSAWHWNGHTASLNFQKFQSFFYLPELECKILAFLVNGRPWRDRCFLSARATLVVIQLSKPGIDLIPSRL